MNKPVFIVFMLIVSTLLTQFTQATSACIIIHGTWASNEEWYQAGGDFFKSLQDSIKEHRCVDIVESFSWSGQLGYLAHQEAAQKLIVCIKKYDEVILVAHSHGATVGVIATQILSQTFSDSVKKVKIVKFYALGMPVDKTGEIYPAMDIVDQFYNVFSFGDMIQKVHGMYDRSLSSHPRISNIAIQIEDKHPAHGQLHSPIIGFYLLKIPDWYQKFGIAGFDIFQHGLDGIITFFPHGLPTYQIDHNRESTLYCDRMAHELMVKAFFRKSSIESEFALDGFQDAD